MTNDELHDYCRYLRDKSHAHGVPDEWSEGYEYALSRVMYKCHEGLTEDDRKVIAEWREKHWRRRMKEQYKVCAIFWEPRGTRVREIKNIDTLRDLLSKGWRITRVDCLPADNNSDISDTALIYILARRDDAEIAKTIGDALTDACTSADTARAAKLLCYMAQPPLWITSRETVAAQIEHLWANLGMCHAQGVWLDMARDLIARKQTRETR